MLTIERRPDSGATRRTAPMPYVASLDGARAVAVLAVLLYHDGLSWIRGGFLGVEVFFVISGYLITSILLGQHRAHGLVDLKRFWLGRARRLLPALYLMVAVVAVWWLLFFPDLVGKLKGQFLGGALYFSNWYLVFTKVSYFDHLSRPSPLLHLWSLAVEEQFYLLWPVLLWLLLKVFKGRPLPLLSAIISGALASSLVMALLYRPGHDPSAVYYGTETRASGLLIGAAVAVVWRPWLSRRRPNRTKGIVADIGGLAALGLLLLFFRFSTEQGAFLYRGGFLLVGLTTGLLIAACVTKSNQVLRSGLGSKALVWVGKRSYGIYLWHWPVFVVLQPGSLSGVPLFLVRLAVTGILAAASYRYVEQPVRAGLVRRSVAQWRAAEGQRHRQLSLRAAAGSGVAVTVVGVLVVSLAVHAPGKSTLQQQLEQAAKDPANRGSVSSLGIRTTPATTPTSAPTTLPGPGTTVATTTTTVPPVTGPPTVALGPYAIGDSVMLGAANALRSAIPGIRIDAQIGRQWNAGVALAQSLHSGGQLGPTVIIALGNNGTVTPAGFDAMMAALAGIPHVIVVDVRVDRSWQSSDNAIMVAGAAKYPAVRVLDWFGYSAGHGAWFYADGTHLRPNTANMYAALIAAAVPPPGR